MIYYFISNKKPMLRALAGFEKVFAGKNIKGQNICCIKDGEKLCCYL